MARSLRMASLSALMGASLAWLLVLSLSCAAGAGIVFAWQRWGARVAIPAGARSAVERLLGAPVATAEPRTPVDGAPLAPVAVPEPAEPRGDDPAQPALRITPGGAATAAEMAAPDDEPEPVMVRPKTSRADAIEELTAIFRVSYDEAVALVEAGLWGLDNHEEWTRAVRQGTRPDTVAEGVMQRVLARSSAEIAPELEAFRVKRRALRDLESLWGVGPEQAEALFEAGFDGREAIRRATTEKLSRVDGIGRALAFQIRAAAHDLAPTA